MIDCDAYGVRYARGNNRVRSLRAPYRYSVTFAPPMLVTQRLSLLSIAQ